MKLILLLGVTLIAMGTVLIGHGQYGYAATETLFQIGSLNGNGGETQSMVVPPVFGWLLIAGGACAAVFGALSRK